MDKQKTFSQSYQLGFFLLAGSLLITSTLVRGHFRDPLYYAILLISFSGIGIKLMQLHRRVTNIERPDRGILVLSWLFPLLTFFFWREELFRASQELASGQWDVLGQIALILLMLLHAISVTITFCQNSHRVG